MNRFKKITLFVTALAVCVGASAQKDLVISGGNGVSSLVCGNNDVYVCGNNKPGQTVGTLGVGSPANTVNTWTKVAFPNDASGNRTTMQQVNSGSGCFFIALDCKGQAWGWGDNGEGQTGTGVSGAVTTPMQIKAGEAANIAAFNDGHGNLAGVSVVYAGNENGYAIMNDGRLMAWGAGDGYGGRGGNGDGTSTDRATPVFVKTRDGQHLQNVISVFAGDHSALALVDPDGDGIGTVYSWGGGDGACLGRNGDGSVWTTDGAGLWAQPVMKNATETLDNIVAIACGDKTGFALDAEGYVWSWGDAGYGGACGWGVAGGGSGIPQRVVAGNTTGASNDGTYLLAKAIGAGQSVAMAITADGKPVVWGTMNDNAPTSQSCKSPDNPSYVEYASGSVHSDVILINKGDNWGFYGRADGTMWTWGSNMYGAMGDG